MSGGCTAPLYALNFVHYVSGVSLPLLETGVVHNSDRLVYTVTEAGRFLGLGRNAAYAAAQRGDIPTIRIGRLLLVPKVPFHRMLGIVATATTSAANAADVDPEASESKGKGKKEEA